MERPALFVGDAVEGVATLDETEVRERMKQGIPPESAEEYLLRVRIESNDLPAVVEAHVPEFLKKKQTMYMPSTEPVPVCPSYLLPSEEWEREVLSTFVDLRLYLRRWKATAGVDPADRIPVPALKDNTGWHVFCLGFAGEEEEEEEEEHSDLGSICASGPALISSESHHRQEKQHPRQLPRQALSGGVRRDPRADDDAQSSYCITPVESSSRFDRFTATLANTSEVSTQGEEDAAGDESRSPSKAAASTSAGASTEEGAAEGEATGAAAAAAAVAAVAISPAAAAGGVSSFPTKGEACASGEAAGGAGGAGSGDAIAGGRGGVEETAVVERKKAVGREWLQTYPNGTPPTMRLAMQFDQVLTQRVLAFHAEWLRDNLLSRARAVWIYTLLACLERPLGSEIAALVREILRRCCAQRAEVESPHDDNLPALNIITAITGRFFQQAETG